MKKFYVFGALFGVAIVLSGCAPLESEAATPRFQTEMSYFEETLNLPVQTEVDTKNCYYNPEKIRYSITTFYMGTSSPDADYARLVKLADDRGYDLYFKSIFGARSWTVKDGHQIEISTAERDDQGTMYLSTEYVTPCYGPDDLPEYKPRQHGEGTY